MAKSFFACSRLSFAVPIFAFVLASALLMASSSFANDIYIAQSAIGAANGSDCNNTLASSFFNSSSNWGTGSNQIGAGTTVHLCGTISGAAGANGLTFQGSGTSGNPVTLLFEDGAVMTSPQWSAAISSNGQNYITIDGGTNGTIVNTANGTGLKYQNGSAAISITGGSSIEIRNLTIANIYIHTGTGSDGGSTGGIVLPWGAQTDLSIHDNTIHDVQNGIFISYTSLNGANIYKNTTYNHRWGIAVMDSNNGSTATNVIVHDNDVHDFINWFDSGFNFHFDGIFFAATNSGTSFTHSSIYNNYVHGGTNVNGTGLIYLSGTGGGLSDIEIYNNVLAPTIGTPGSPEADIVLGWGPKNIRIYNNTLVGSEGIRIRDSGANGIAIENNIFSQNWMAIELYANNIISLSDHNDFDTTGGASSGHLFSCSGTFQGTLANWQSSCHLDANSVTGSANFAANYRIGSGSAASGLAVNLTSLGIPALNVDMAGTSRPLSGAWDSGAYQIGSSNATRPAAPTGLTAQVQ